MFPVGTAHFPTRALCGTLFAIMLALRLLTPAGFMPAFDRGTVTIVVCPDAEAAPTLAMAAHHHQHGNGHHQQLHQPCPYASASALGAVAVGFAPAVGVLIPAPALLLGRNFLLIDFKRAHLRPPLRGPPLPA